jgi:hypothetical protein|tara:strand:- start:109 stop:957 length:849 start_codon:yes stop_codon:yes gene_type:complete
MNDTNLDKKKVVIGSIIKNVEKDIPNFFKLVTKISSMYSDYSIILVESDSTDNTFYVAKKFLEEKKGKIIKVNTDKCNYRTERISLCRNQIILEIKKDNKLNKFDHLIILDADNINTLLTPEKIRNTLNMAPQDWLGIFPNQYFFYYDLWALRIDKYFDYDCFQKFKEYSSHKNIKKIYNDIIFKNFFVIKKFKNRFIKVKSAFGGMGIYRLKLVLNSHYNANGGKNSEHVMFHNMITSQNKEILYIDKDLINSYGLNEHIFKGFCYRTFDYFARRLAKKQI